MKAEVAKLEQMLKTKREMEESKSGSEPEARSIGSEDETDSDVSERLLLMNELRMRMTTWRCCHRT